MGLFSTFMDSIPKAYKLYSNFLVDKRGEIIVRVVQDLINIAYQVSCMFGFIQIYEKFTPHQPAVLCWHDINHLQEYYNFQEQIIWLFTNKKIISLETLMAEPCGNKVVLTFDDGYESLYTTIFPLLQKYEIPFSAFITSSFIGHKGYINRQQLQEIALYPFVEIGAHSRSHVRLSHLTKSKLLDEIIGCKKDLEDILGKQVISFAYPFGKAKDVGLEAVILCKKAGFQLALSTERGFITRVINPYWIPRIVISPLMNTYYLRRLLAGCFWLGDFFRITANQIRRLL